MGITNKNRSEKENYETPPGIFKALNEVFHFNNDLAADVDNALCPNYFTFEDNSLEQNWNELQGWSFCNPPYGRGKGKVTCFMNKAYEEGDKIVFLVPVKAGLRWWHNIINDKYNPYYCFLFLGRIKFFLNKVITKDKGTFDSQIIIKSKEPLADTTIKEVKEKLELAGYKGSWLNI